MQNVSLFRRGGWLCPNLVFLEPNAMKKKKFKSVREVSGFRKFMMLNHPEILKKWSNKPQSQDGFTDMSTNNQILNRKWRI